MTQIKIVIGSNFGDEGKGLMTDYFAADMMRRYGRCLNVLSNGGPQRGHTVVRGGLRHVFRHFGAGTLCGADTFFPAEFLVNPMIFMKELGELEAADEPADKVADEAVDKAADVTADETVDETADRDGGRGLFLPGIHMRNLKIYIHPDCLITTPYEMITNLILEEHRGNRRHGSVGVGIWETVIGGGLTFGKLHQMTREERFAYLTQNRVQRMKKRLAEQGVDVIPDTWQEVLQGSMLAEQYLDDFEDMEKRIILADDAILRQYEGILFENGQGLLLDRRMKWKGYGDHTTPSYTGVKNPLRILKRAFLEEEQSGTCGSTDGNAVYGNSGKTGGVDGNAVHGDSEKIGSDDAKAVYGNSEKTGNADGTAGYTKDGKYSKDMQIEVVYVTRTYMTRHGAGRFDTECPKEELNPEIEDLTNQPNPSQGTIRFGRLNYRSLLRRTRRDFAELTEDPAVKKVGILPQFSIAATHLNEYNRMPEQSPYIRYKSDRGEGVEVTGDALI